MNVHITKGLKDLRVDRTSHVMHGSHRLLPSSNLKWLSRNINSVHRDSTRVSRVIFPCTFRRFENEQQRRTCGVPRLRGDTRFVLCVYGRARPGGAERSYVGRRAFFRKVPRDHKSHATHWPSTQKPTVHRLPRCRQGREGPSPGPSPACVRGIRGFFVGLLVGDPGEILSAGGSVFVVSGATGCCCALPVPSSVALVVVASSPPPSDPLR